MPHRHRCPRAPTILRSTSHAVGLMDASAGPYGVAHATFSPDGGTATCAARPANPFVAAFCRLNRPNPYSRFADTAPTVHRSASDSVQSPPDGQAGGHRA